MPIKNSDDFLKDFATRTALKVMVYGKILSVFKKFLTYRKAPLYTIRVEKPQGKKTACFTLTRNGAFEGEAGQYIIAQCGLTSSLQKFNSVSLFVNVLPVYKYKLFDTDEGFRQYVPTSKKQASMNVVTAL